MDIKIPTLGFPSEDVLQFIENNRRIVITRDAYVSREFYNCNHPEGKFIPAFSANNGKGDGKHTVLVELDGVVYCALHCGSDKDEVIPRHKSGRGNEQR